MENLSFALNTILPLLLIIASGFFCKKLKLVNDTIVRGCNNLVFRVFLPILLMRNLMQTTMDKILNPKIFIYISISICVFFGILFLIIPRIYKDRRITGTVIQGMARCNYAVFGIPLVTMLFPDQDISIISLLTIVVVPLVNTLSIISLVAFSGEKMSIAKSIKSIILNPLLVGSVIGFVFMLFSIPVPTFIDNALLRISQIASPLALFMLGASLEFRRIISHRKTLFATTFTKLVLAPLIFVTGACLLNIKNVELAAVLITFGAPTSVNSYTMAQQMGGDGDLAGEIVVFTSFFSIFTVFIMVYILKTLGYF